MGIRINAGSYFFCEEHNICIANVNLTDTIKLNIPKGLYAIFETLQVTHLLC